MMMQTSHEITSAAADDTTYAASQVDKIVKEPKIAIKSSQINTHRADLSLNIPKKHAHFGPVISSDGETSSRGFFKGLSFKKKTPGDGEKSPLLDHAVQPESPLVTKIKSIFYGNRSASLPVKHGSNWSPSTPVSARTYSEQQKSQAAKPPVSRSLTMPSRNIVIVRSISFAARKDNDQIDSDDDQIRPVEVENEEEIAVEEAICRVCMDTCDEGNQFMLACCCKGALKLMHEKCVVKWFSIKGDKMCDVCGREVTNLPVMLFRKRSYAQLPAITAPNQQGLDPRTISAGQDIVRLILISTICYFFLIEQLLVDELKTRAVVIAAPFAFTFGILSSTFAAVLAIREYIWRYAVLEFALVAMLLQVFYSWLQLKATYAVMVSSVIGFGLAMALNALYIRYTVWRLQRLQDYNILN
ncbi:uncharacterized protein LOC143562832 isoform X2 [Bidens hawaiensis]|uniref:uncharacterized protein LOC143562832 isoform X2 n=1 Tax=Bidens hawaiensis TaxID=980011 RepID=UPI004049107C